MRRKNSLLQKVLAMLLCLSMALSLLPMTTLAAEGENPEAGNGVTTPVAPPAESPDASGDSDEPALPTETPEAPVQEPEEPADAIDVEQQADTTPAEITALLNEIQKAENIPDGQEIVSYSNTYQGTNVPEPYTAITGTVSSETPSGKDNVALGANSAAVLDASPYLSAGMIEIKFKHDFAVTGEDLANGLGFLIKGDAESKSYMSVRLDVGKGGQNDWVVEGSAGAWQNIKDATTPAMNPNTEYTFTMAYYKDKLILALDNKVFFDGTSSVLNAGAFEDALGQFGLRKRFGAATVTVSSVNISGVGTKTKPAKPAVTYTQDYESSYTPNFSKPGIASVQTETGGNKYLKLNASAGRVADLDSPNILNGTVSLRYRREGGAGFGLGYRYSNDGATFSELGCDGAGKWVQESNSGYPGFDAFPTSPEVGVWHDVMFSFETASGKTTVTTYYNGEFYSTTTTTNPGTTAGKLGFRLLGAALNIDDVKYTDAILTPPKENKYENDFQQVPGNWDNATVTLVTEGDNKVAKLALTDAVNDAIMADSPELTGGTYRVKAMSASTQLRLSFGTASVAWDGANWVLKESGKADQTITGQAAAPIANVWNDIAFQFGATGVKLSVNGKESALVLSAHAFPKGKFGVGTLDSAASLYVDDLLYTERARDITTTAPEQGGSTGLRYEQYYTFDGSYPWTGAAETPVQANGRLTVKTASNTAATVDAITPVENGTYQMLIKADKHFDFVLGNLTVSESGGAWSVQVGANAALALGTGEAIASNVDLAVRLKLMDNYLTLFVNNIQVGASTAVAGFNKAGGFGIKSADAVTASVDAVTAEELAFLKDDYSADTSGNWTKTGATVTYETGKLKVSGSTLFAQDSRADFLNAKASVDFSPDQTADSANGNYGRYGFSLRGSNRDNCVSVVIDVNGAWEARVGGSSIGKFTTKFIPEANKVYTMELTVNGNTVSAKIIDKATNVETGLGSFTSTDLSKTPAGGFGVYGWQTAKTLTLTNLRVEGLESIPVLALPVRTETLVKDGMTVTLDQGFPRVISYALNSKTMDGQTTAGQALVVNGEAATPMVSFVKTNDTQATYTMTVPGKLVLETVVTLEANHVLQMLTTVVGEESGFKLRTLAFQNNALLHTDDTKPGASYAWMKSTGIWHEITEELVDDISTMERAEIKPSTIAMLGGSGLAAAIETNSMDGNAKVVLTKAKSDIYKSVGIEAGVWTYRHSQMDAIEQDGKLWLKVAITEDQNSDTKADWQDAAVAYREYIMLKAFGAETVRNTMTYIPFNFASQANDPFLNSLDTGKALYNLTDGFGQRLLEKGYQAEGHDDDIPSYSNIGVRQGGVDDFNMLINEGAKYNMRIGVHINATEYHADANELYYGNLPGATSAGYFADYAAKRLGGGWDWIDTSHGVDQTKDVVSGQLKTRIDSLIDLTNDNKGDPNDPKLDFIYVDVYTGNQYNAYKLLEYANKKGAGLATEFAGPFEPGVLFTHWGNDPGYPNKGNNSKLSRMVKGDLDLFVGDSLLKSNKMPIISYWGDSKSDLQQGVEIFFNEVLPAKYRQHFGMLKMEPGKYTYDNGMTITLNTATKMVEMRKDGKLVSTWADTPRTDENEYHYAASDSLIPWTWDMNTNADLGVNGGAKLYHWNTDGVAKTWELTDYFKNVASFDLYEMTRTGRVLVKEVTAGAGKLTLDTKKNTAYVLYPHGTNVETYVPTAGDWGEGSPAKDFAFNSGALNGADGAAWTTTGGASIYTTPGRPEYQGTKETTLNRWENQLRFDTTGGTATQTLTGLEPNQDYTVGVWVEAVNGRKATIEVTIDGKTYTNFVTGKDSDHKSNFKYRNTNWQRMAVEFKVPAGVTTATLTLKAEAGTGNVSFDDVKVWKHTTVEPSLTKEGYLLYEDFENVYEGWGPFEYGGGALRIALCTDKSNDYDKNEIVSPGTMDVQGPVMTWVLDGQNALKSNEVDGDKLFYTNESSLLLAPNTTYSVEFLYTLEQNDYNVANPSDKDGIFIEGPEEYNVYVVTPDGKKYAAFSSVTSSVDGTATLIENNQRIKLTVHKTTGDKTNGAKVQATFTTGDAPYYRIQFEGTTWHRDGYRSSDCAFVLDNFGVRQVNGVDTSGIVNGTVTAAPASGNVGDTVTLTVTPNEGYVLDANSLKVNNGAVTVTAVEGQPGKYTFAMPSGTATVTATFSKLAYAVTLPVSVNGGVTADKASPVVWGESVTLTVAPAAGYRLKADSLKANNGTVELTPVPNQSGKYTFTMPKAAVTVAAEFEAITYSVTVSGMTNGTVTTDKATAKQGDTVTLTVAPAADYVLTTGSLKVNSGETTVSAAGDKYTFTMPGKDAVVTAAFEKTKFAVTVGALTNGAITVSPTGPVSWGETVSLTVTPAAGYRLKAGTLKFNGNAVTGSTFTMPKAAVNVTAEFELIPAGSHNITVSALTNGSVATSVTSAVKDETVTLTVAPAKGYQLTANSLKVNGGAVAVSAVAGQPGKYTFTMPDAAVTVTAAFEKVSYTVTKSADNGTVTVNATAQYGDTVAVAVTANAGYTIKSVTVTGATGVVDLTTVSAGSYTFVMPAENVTVTATFEKTKYTVTVGAFTNGAITVSPTSPVAWGETVTLTVTPSAGYRLKADSLKFNTTAVTGNTFTMPKEDVTVTAEFELIPPDSHNITVTQPTNGTVVSDKVSAAKDETVTLTVTANTGYTIKTVTVTGASGAVDVSTVSAGNYTFVMPAENVTVTATFNQQSGGGDQPSGGGSTGGSAGNTVTNPDGSKTTTTTDKATGTVTETTTAKDGSKSVVKTAKDGSVTADVTLSGKTEGAVTLPVKPLPTENTTVTVKTDKTVKVTVPVADAKPGVVAVLVNEDGTETILRKSVTTKAGLAVTLDDTATLKLVDNSKSFADVSENHWAHDAVAFASSRELFEGTGRDTFSPHLEMTRSMLVTVLYRMESEPDAKAGGFADVAADAWYAEAVGWASEKGIVTGTGSGFVPNATLNRESLAVMLYRYAEQNGMEMTAGSEAVERYDDAATINTWAKTAMSWAVDNGILTGMGAGKLDPGGVASRAEVAAMLMRLTSLLNR